MPHIHLLRKNVVKMAELNSASAPIPNALSFRFKYSFLQIVTITIFLLSSIAESNGFDPLILLSKKTVVLNIDKFGAKGDGKTDDSKKKKTKIAVEVYPTLKNYLGTSYTSQVQLLSLPIDFEMEPLVDLYILLDVWNAACSMSSRVKIVIPSGNAYLVNPTSFGGPCKSYLTLRISGTIVAPKDPEIWDGLDLLKWLYFHGVNYLTVEGGGTINGIGQKWWSQSCKTNSSNPCTNAPRAITFHKCNHLKIRKLNLVDSQQVHMAFTNCINVSASRLRVTAPSYSPNTDGIHISESTHVQIKNATIHTGDDCVSIVSNSSHISINNVICGPGHGISIGSLGKSNSSDEVQNVVVDAVTFFDTQNGVRIKTWQGGSGVARKIKFQNIQMHNVSNPIIIDQYYCDSPRSCPNQTSAVIIDSISFRNIKGTSATEEAITLSCSESHPCKRLYLEDIQLVSLSGTAKSFCWEAYGTSSGVVHPPSCLSSTGAIARPDLKSDTTSQYTER